MTHAQDARDLLDAARAIPRFSIVAGAGESVSGAQIQPAEQIELLLKEAHVEAMLAVAQETRALGLLQFNRDLAEVVAQERLGALKADPDGLLHRKRAESFETLRQDVRREVLALLGYSDRIEREKPAE